MINYIIKRLALVLIVIMGVTTITFFLARVVPGDPVRLWIGDKARGSQIQQAAKELGLDKPLVHQYFDYLSRLAKGDLGFSLRTKRRVSEELAARWTATFELVGAAMLITLVLGLPIGVISAVNKDTPIDHLSRLVSISGVAMAIFWLGMILQLIFHGGLDWLPLQGRIASDVLMDHPIKRITGFYTIDSLITGNWPALLSTIKHLILPTITLSYSMLALVTRMSRSTMLEVLRDNYIETHISYGVEPRSVHYYYALKNALIPTITIVGLAFGNSLGGSFLVESIFDWPGLGKYAILSIQVSDFPAVIGVTILFSITFVLINLFVDLLYYVIDPRIRKPKAT